MKKVSLGLTAIALLVGFASAFASKTTGTGRTFWTTVVHHTRVTLSQVNALCKGGAVTCAIQYTTASGAPTGAIAFKAL
ncbi:MAG: hypothetical protein J7623_16285 [Chitinophaga sp.]|uniref:hypothetical protein n=1 Tax=Chitinophaga sp. TaxID=1869181 RepID=UPI001B181116|nr:hypothetical protein [Chitinophaga sp.]MBO9730199.1 hypothetical protein [Chitinophaga sp.]